MQKLWFYDSKYPVIGNHVKKQIAALVSTQGKKT